MSVIALHARKSFPMASYVAILFLQCLQAGKHAKSSKFETRRVIRVNRRNVKVLLQRRRNAQSGGSGFHRLVSYKLSLTVPFCLFRNHFS